MLYRFEFIFGSDRPAGSISKQSPVQTYLLSPMRCLWAPLLRPRRSGPRNFRECATPWEGPAKEWGGHWICPRKARRLGLTSPNRPPKTISHFGGAGRSGLGFVKADMFGNGIVWKSNRPARRSDQAIKSNRLKID